MDRILHKLSLALQQIAAGSSRPFLFPVEQASFLANRQAETASVAVVDGASGQVLARVPSGAARQIDVLVVADQAIEVQVRVYAAGRLVTYNAPPTTLTAGSATTIQYTGPAGVEVALVATNATGTDAVASAWLRAI
jgi:hypothetical protein